MDKSSLGDRMKQINGWPDYFITTGGTVLSKKSGQLKGLRPQYNRGSGYLKITLSKNGIKKDRPIHRLVAETFIPNPNSFPQINHIDGDKKNNNYDNLEWCTSKHNHKHAVRCGLKAVGESHGMHKLTYAQVEKIRCLYKSGHYSQRQLAKNFNVSQATIWDIVNNNIWITK